MLNVGVLVYRDVSMSNLWQMRAMRRITMTVAAATLAARAMNVGVRISSIIVVRSSRMSTSTL